MHLFSRSIFSRFVSVICMFCFFFYSSLSVLAAPLIQFDEANYRVHFSRFNFNDQIEVQTLLKKIEIYEKTDQRWQICNHGNLDISFSELSLLSYYADIINKGQIRCLLDEQISAGKDSYDLDTFCNLGAITFINQASAPKSSTETATRSIHVSFQTLINKGSLNFEKSLESTALLWDVAIKFGFDNSVGIIRTADELKIRNQSKMRTLSVDGAVSANGLKLEGFDLIRAVLCSGFEDEQTPTSNENKSHLDYVKIQSHTADTTPEFEYYIKDQHEAESAHIDFLWQGQVRTPGAVILNLNRSSNRAIQSHIEPVFDVLGLDINVTSNAASHLKLGSFALNYLTHNNEKIFSEIGRQGLHVNFANVEKPIRGSIDFDATYSILGDLILDNVQKVTLQENSEILFHQDALIDAQSMFIDGIFSHAMDVEHQTLTTAGYITVGEKGQFFVQEFLSPIADGDTQPQLLINKGQAEIEHLRQTDSFKVINSGTFTVKTGVKPLTIEDNTGIVSCSMPILETFSPAFFERHLKKDRLGSECVPITGHIESLMDVHVDLSAAYGRTLYWKQSIIGSSLLFDNLTATYTEKTTETTEMMGSSKEDLQNPLSDSSNIDLTNSAGMADRSNYPNVAIMLRPETVLYAVQDRLKIRARQITTIKGSKLLAPHQVEFDMPLSNPESAIIHQGSIETKHFKAHALTVKGSGTLTIKDLIVVDTYSTDINGFEFGPNLTNIIIKARKHLEIKLRESQGHSKLALTGFLCLDAFSIDISRNIESLGPIQLITSEMNKAKLHINADIKTKGTLFAKSSAITFKIDPTNKHKIGLRGKDIILENTNHSALIVPSNVILKANKKGQQADGKIQSSGVLSVTSLGDLTIYGKLSAEETELKGTKILLNGKDLQRTHALFIEGESFCASIPIKTKKEFNARVDTIKLKALDTTSFNIEAKRYTEINESLTTKTPSLLTTNQLHANGANVSGDITLRSNSTRLYFS